MVKNSKIHETAVIGADVRLGKDVSIGPFCVIEGDVEIGDETQIHSHVSIQCTTKIGKRCKIYPFVSFNISQDLKYRGEDSRIIVGDNTTIREHATINNGSEYDRMETIVGSNCLLMGGVHVGHDCIIGDGVIIANNTVLGGHVKVGDGAILGGMSAIHPKVEIGKGAIIGGMSGVERNVIPYGNAKNDRAFLDGLNIIGMKRSNFSRENIVEMSKFFEELFHNSDLLFHKRLQGAKSKYSNNSDIQYIIDFIESRKDRELCLPKNYKREDE